MIIDEIASGVLASFSLSMIKLNANLACLSVDSSNSATLGAYIFSAAFYNDSINLS